METAADKTNDNQPSRLRPTTHYPRVVYQNPVVRRALELQSQPIHIQRSLWPIVPNR